MPRTADPEKRAKYNRDAKLHMRELRANKEYTDKRNAQRRANHAARKRDNPDQYEIELAARRVEARAKNRDRRAWVNSYKTECRACGEPANEALAFHHVDPSTKSFSLGMDPAGKSEQRLLDEINKCIVLCHNCHAKVKAGTLDVSDITILEQVAL